MKAPRVVRVPDLGHPTWCFQQQTDPSKPGFFGRCTLKKGHTGPHIWERKRTSRARKDRAQP